jgi:phospholipid-binding lipoprotein MlaA
MRHTQLTRSLLCAAIVAAHVASAGSAASDPTPEAQDAEADLELLLEDDDPLFDDAEDLDPAPGDRDPFEELNRDVFDFNRGLDRWVFDPITRGYRFVLPESGRKAVYRMSLNLDTPVVLANHMLQFRPVDAAGTLTRFLFNTSFGVLGLFDPADEVFGVKRVDGDFGQTLARYGTPSGPYLMLPVFGPSTGRDVFGDVVDIVADPVSYLLGPLQWWTLALGGSEGLIVREANLDDLEQLEAGAIDFYAALRSAYLQTRDAVAREAQGPESSSDVVMMR